MVMPEPVLDRFRAAYDSLKDTRLAGTEADVYLAVGFMLGADMPMSAALLVRGYELARQLDHADIDSLKDYLGLI